MLWRCGEQKGGRILSTYGMLAGVAKPDVDTMRDQVFAWGWEDRDEASGAVQVDATSPKKQCTPDRRNSVGKGSEACRRQENSGNALSKYTVRTTAKDGAPCTVSRAGISGGLQCHAKKLFCRDLGIFGRLA